MDYEERDEVCIGGVCVPASRKAARQQRRRLAIALALALGYVIVEIGGALATGSLALLADAGHMLTDVGALALALFAIWFADRPASPQKSYGYYRAEILAALANALLLFLVVGFVFYEAYRRLLEPTMIDAVPMLAVAAVGLLVNVAGLLVLREGAGESLNLEAAFTEMLGDAVSSLAVLLGGLTIWVTRVYRIDAALSVLIGIFVLTRTWKLLNRALNVLLEGSPAHVDVAEVRSVLLQMPGVWEVHDLHVWTITSGFEAMSGHIRVVAEVDQQNLLEDIRRLLRERFGIDHVTIQVEERVLREKHLAE